MSIFVQVSRFFYFFIAIAYIVCPTITSALSPEEKFILATSYLNKNRFDIGVLIKEATQTSFLAPQTIQSLSNALAYLESFDYWRLEQLIKRLVMSGQVTPNSQNLWSAQNIDAMIKRSHDQKAALRQLLAEKSMGPLYPVHTDIAGALPKLFQEPDLSMIVEPNPLKRRRTETGEYIPTSKKSHGFSREEEPFPRRKITRSH